jgi:hypothetical protein
MEDDRCSSKDLVCFFGFVILIFTVSVITGLHFLGKCGFLAHFGISQIGFVFYIIIIYIALFFFFFLNVISMSVIFDPNGFGCGFFLLHFGTFSCLIFSGLNKLDEYGFFDFFGISVFIGYLIFFSILFLFSVIGFFARFE